MERPTSENSSVPASELGRDKEETNRAVVVGPEMSGESEWNVVTMPLLKCQQPSHSRTAGSLWTHQRGLGGIASSLKIAVMANKR